jgi:hypothetical protein
MNPHKVAAQFLACVMFTHTSSAQPKAREAMQFARDNWLPFLPWADEGLGRLLIHIASPRQSDPNEPCHAQLGTSNVHGALVG